MELAGHIQVLGGPHVARGPDVAQACSNWYIIDKKKLLVSYLFIHSK